MFEVKLRPSHPTGVYHRAGKQFNKLTPVTMDVVPRAIKDDPNLIVKEQEKPESPKGNGGKDKK